MAEVQQKFFVDIPEDLSGPARLDLGKRIIQRVIDRTAANTDVNGNKFANYSDSYANSKDFKIAGKNKNDPNLRLTNEMLDSLAVLNHSPGRLEIGYLEGTPENDKAAWAQADDNGPSRRFLGINDTDLELLVAEVRVDTLPDDAAKQVVDNILANLGFDTEDEFP